MGVLNACDAAFNMGINVVVTKKDKKTGRVLQQEKGHNRCLKQTLLGIAKYLNGEFNPTQPLYEEGNPSYRLEWDWIPSYLGVGTNIAGGTMVQGVTSEVSVNDTKLLNEISPRMKLPERNKLIARTEQAFVQLVINTYLPDELYIGERIGEAGLFANETGNNCLFRIALKEPILKEVDTVVEIMWTISIVSIDSNNSEYVEVDKSDLRMAMEHLLDLYQLYTGNGTTADISQSVADFKTGIYDFYRGDIDQDGVNVTTQTLYTDYNDLVQKYGGPALPTP